MMKNKKKNGFTLIELIVVVAIIIVILGLSSFTMFSRSGTILKTAASQVKGAYQNAKQRAITERVKHKLKVCDKDDTDNPNTIRLWKHVSFSLSVQLYLPAGIKVFKNTRQILFRSPPDI